MASPAVLHLSVISAVLLLCAPSATFASITPDELVAFIGTVTSQGQRLQPVAQSISIVNGPLIVIGQGPYPRIISGFQEMVKELTNMIETAKDTEPFQPSDAELVATAVRELVPVHQVLLNILIGKIHLFSEVPMIGQPVSAVLRAYEATIDTFLYTVIDIASPEAVSISGELEALDDTIVTAVKAHDPPHFVQ